MCGCVIPASHALTTVGLCDGAKILIWKEVFVI